MPGISDTFGSHKIKPLTTEDTTLANDDLFSRGGEMGAIMRLHDWASTPLGPVEQWPPSLKTVVRILLTSRYAMWMGWGPDLTFLYNDTYGRITLGKKHPWALGRPAREVWSEIWKDIHPRIQRVLDTGEATWDEALLLFLERSGFPEETYHTFSYSPLIDEQGRIPGMLCVVTEETERVIGERQLRSLRSLATELGAAITEEDVLSAIQRSLSQNQKDLPFTLTYLFNSETSLARLACSTGFDSSRPASPNVIEVNSSESVWPIRDLLARNHSIVVEGLAARFDPLPSGAWSEPPTRALLVPISRQGQESPAGFLVAALNPYRQLNADYTGYIDLVAGQIAASLANAHAYEEERRRAEALAEIDRAKTTFFSNVSHELRTPLTLMLGPIEDELERGQQPPATRQSLELVHRNALRLLKLVNTLLEFSRVESGRAQAKYEPVDLAALTTDLASVFRSAIERAGIRLIVDCPALAEPVYVDREMWEKIVLNLLSNALKSTFQGEIAVLLRSTDAGAELSIRDTGTGIPDQEVAHLFERFRRIEGARRRTHEGSGIGLALVQELVRMHEGSIAVDTAVGVGTTFSVTVPFGNAHLPRERLSAGIQDRPTGAATAYVQEALSWLRAPASEVDASTLLLERQSLDRISDGSDGTGPARVLLVDDNRDMRDYVSQLLSRRFDVVTAANGKLALEEALRTTPELILTDVMMPVMDGFELLSALRQDERTSGIPVIMLSARAGEDSRIEGLEAGADDYLVKPFTARELMARVSAHIATSRLRHQAARRERELLAETELERNRLQEIFMQAPAMIALVAGPDHRFALANERYVRNVGRKSAEDLLGKALPDALPELRGQVFLELLDRVYRTGEQYLGNEHLVQLARGEEGRMEDAYFNFAYQPWRKADGAIEGVFVHAVEVTESVIARKEVEELAASVKESESRFRAILSQVVSGICRTDLAGKFIFVNERYCEITGRSREELLGLRLQDILHPEDLGHYKLQFRNLVEHGKTFEAVGRYVRTDGRTIWVQNNLSAALDESGQPQSVVCVAQDITERKQAEEALLRSEKLAAVGRLASTIAHEINNPLESVTNLLYLIQTVKTHEEVQSYAALASEELARVSHVVTDTLRFHRRLETPTPERVSVLLDSAAGIFQGRLKNSAISLVRQYRDHNPVQCNGGEIRQVFSNLIGNAFDASRSGNDNRIILRTRERTEWNTGRRGVCVTVADTGHGMDEDTLKHLFEPFFTTKSSNGTGLGLWVSLNILKKHRAKLQVRSRQSDSRSGTVFSLFLPFLSDSSE